ncbi:NAD(P)H-dependent glycerol-3-phosphate dehydrogenase [Eisenbergiella porci]|uniref:NAD(P)H-dependent glycerol-3-phosphate dehydrogenase n=1 Tax=Eisenbergiella porci TaxID=2652274 RepID=UPI002A809F56|nr:NAD(P)H-dependent glycerol-3-phosphate dehydrogenase [Eisenbergiella porci]
MAEIGMIGAGSWGTALTWLLTNNGHHVTVWSALDAEIEMLKKDREQKSKLPGVILSEDTRFTTDLKAAVEGKDLLVLAVPSPFTRSTAVRLKDVVEDGQIIVNVAKGIEENTLMTLSQIIEEEVPQAEVAVLSGPSHAEEVGKGLPTVIVAGAKHKETAEYIQNIFMNEVFRVYASPDVLGIEIGAALKNVVALAAGIADGLGYGDNTKAALITRGITEIARLGIKMGGHFETFCGLSGIGDLIVTCASMHSRNRRAGILIGKGYTMEEAMDEVKMVVEGVYSAKAAMTLAEKYEVQLPIIEQVNEVLFHGKAAAQAVNDLMLRDKKIEISGDTMWS